MKSKCQWGRGACVQNGGARDMELNIVKVDYKGDGKGDNVQKQHALFTLKEL